MTKWNTSYLLPVSWRRRDVRGNSVRCTDVRWARETEGGRHLASEDAAKPDVDWIPHCTSCHQTGLWKPTYKTTSLFTGAFTRSGVRRKSLTVSGSTEILILVSYNSMSEWLYALTYLKNQSKLWEMSLTFHGRMYRARWEITKWLNRNSCTCYLYQHVYNDCMLPYLKNHSPNFVKYV